MTDNSERLPDDAEASAEREAGNLEYALADTIGRTPQNDTASLVLLINTVLGGLCMVYASTKSVVITLVSALQVLLIVGTVIVVQRRDGRDGRPCRKDDRSGR